MPATLHRLREQLAPPRTSRTDSVPAAEDSGYQGPRPEPPVTARRAAGRPWIRLVWLLAILVAPFFLWWGLIRAVVALIGLIR